MPENLLVQFDRAVGQYKVIFEDTDSSRWKVTPENSDEVRAELRPRL
ncbi:hypothetical protein [Occultella glacieicola]|nr:hypothetical protein [Occultella glacieicola]